MNEGLASVYSRRMGNVSFCQLLKQAMFTIDVAEFVYSHKKECPENGYDSKAQEHVHARDVEYGKHDHQHDDAAPQVPDVLCFQTFEFYRFVNYLVDFVNAVHGGLIVFGVFYVLMAYFLKSVVSSPTFCLAADSWFAVSVVHLLLDCRAAGAWMDQ